MNFLGKINCIHEQAFQYCLLCNRKFLSECPSGLITLHEFRRQFCDGTVGLESAEYAEEIFRTLDSNGV